MTQVYVVLRPENLLPVVVCEEHQEATDRAARIKGEVAPVELVEVPRSVSDTELLNFLQDMLNQKNYTGKVICRWSSGAGGRGWRLHETDQPGAVTSVRQAISNMMDQEVP